MGVKPYPRFKIPLFQKFSHVKDFRKEILLTLTDPIFAGHKTCEMEYSQESGLRFVCPPNISGELCEVAVPEWHFVLISPPNFFRVSSVARTRGAGDSRATRPKTVYPAGSNSLAVTMGFPRRVFLRISSTKLALPWPAHSINCCRGVP